MNKLFIKIIIFLIFLIKFGESLLNEIVLEENSNFKFRWELIGNEEILIQLLVDGKSWVGIGWSDDRNGMKNSDYIVGTFDSNGNFNINDMVVTSGASSNKPVLDTTLNGGTNDILSAYGYQTSNSTFIQFIRKLSTGDTIGDKDLIIGNGIKTNILWAKGNSQNLGYHGNSNRGSINVDLNVGGNGDNSMYPVTGNNNNEIQVEIDGPSKSEIYLNWHVALMVSSFLVLMPLGIFVARYMRHYYYWFPLHYMLLGFSFSFVLVGFILAFMMTPGRTFSKHVLHAWFGLFTFILMSVVVIMGVMSHLMWKPTRKHVPIFPDITHAMIARLTFLIALVTIWTGFDHYSLPNQYSIVLGFIVAIFFAIIIFLEIYKKKCMIIDEDLLLKTNKNLYKVNDNVDLKERSYSTNSTHNLQS